MMNRSDFTRVDIIRQLKDVFPGLDEEFLAEFCDGYPEDEIQVEEIIDVILSLDIVPPVADFPILSIDDEGLDVQVVSGKSDGVVSVSVSNEAVAVESIIVPDEITVVAEQNCIKVELCSNIVEESSHDNKYDDVYDIRLLFDSESFSSDECSAGVQPDEGGDSDEEYSDYDSSSDIAGDADPRSSNYVQLKPQGCKPKKVNKVTRKKSKLFGTPRQRKPSFCETKLKKRNDSKFKVICQKRLSLEGNGSCLKSMQSPKFEKAESRLALLAKVLPDADHQYLSDRSKTLTDDGALLLFISESLDLKDYPKVNHCSDESPPMMENFECSIDEFLKEIPDPSTEFSSNTYMRSGYEKNAEIYLQTRYQDVQPDELENRLRRHEYNLTRVCGELDDEGWVTSPYCLDTIPLHHPASIFFHQEVWYIENRREIENLMTSAVEAVHTEELINRVPTPPPPVVREVFECGICAEEVDDYNQLGSCDARSGHLFCYDCIRRQVEIKFSEGDVWFFCLVNCGGKIPLQTIKEVLPAQLYKKLEDKVHGAQVIAANIPGIENCPFCEYAYCPGEEKLFNCRNDDCRQISCRICKKLDHSPNQCRMFQEEDEETARHMIEERMAQALIRKCHSCGKAIVKEEGCNKMTCTCGALMCYLCRQPVTDYKHFNGPGGDNHHRCELYSSEEALHVAPVLASGQQALNEILRNNPGIKIDANQIIPK